MKGKELTDKELDHRFAEATKAAIHRLQVKKLPVARYDIQEKKAYLEYPDGQKKYAEA